MNPPDWRRLAPLALPMRLPPLGDLEAVVLRALHAQREAYHRTQSTLPLCLDLPTLAAQLARRPDTIQRAISRLNAKLAAQSLIIVCFHVPSLELVSYALFRLEEVWLFPPPCPPTDPTRRVVLVH